MVNQLVYPYSFCRLNYCVRVCVYVLKLNNSSSVSLQLWRQQRRCIKLSPVLGTPDLRRRHQVRLRNSASRCFFLEDCFFFQLVFRDIRATRADRRYLFFFSIYIPWMKILVRIYHNWLARNTRLVKIDKRDSSSPYINVVAFIQPRPCITQLYVQTFSHFLFF
jgi:hypothetical protein